MYSINHDKVTESVRFGEYIIDALMSENQRFISVASLDRCEIYDYSTMKQFQLRTNLHKRIAKIEMNGESQLVIIYEDCSIEMFKQNNSQPYKQRQLNVLSTVLNTTFCFKKVDDSTFILLNQHMKTVTLIDISTMEDIYEVTEKYELNSIEISSNSQMIVTSGRSEDIIIYRYNCEKR